MFGVCFFLFVQVWDLSGVIRTPNRIPHEKNYVCEKLGINAWEVIDAAATKPFGFMKFSPGPGLGGHCIPIDPYYLSWKLKTLDYDARFIKLAGEINTQMPKHVIDLISNGLNHNQKSINGSKIMILGLAYKKNINDFRESPAIDILQLLINLEADVIYHDPYIAEITIDSKQYVSHDINEKILKSSDICVVVTDHDDINYEMILNYSEIIIDTRNVFKNNNSDKIIRLGQTK